MSLIDQENVVFVRQMPRSPVDQHGNVVRNSDVMGITKQITMGVTCVCAADTGRLRSRAA